MVPGYPYLNPPLRIYLVLCGIRLMLLMWNNHIDWQYTQVLLCSSKEWCKCGRFYLEVFLCETYLLCPEDSYNDSKNGVSFEKYCKSSQHTNQFKAGIWNQNTLLHKAIRGGDFGLYGKCFIEIAPWFFAFTFVTCYAWTKQLSPLISHMTWITKFWRGRSGVVIIGLTDNKCSESIACHMGPERILRKYEDWILLLSKNHHEAS